jgi:hypothetical protein
MDNTSVLIFKAIVSFISDLSSTYAEKHKSIALYNRLLEKTGLSNVGPIHKHIDCFRKFFSANKTAMTEKKVDLFTVDKISYSDRVFVDVKSILKDKNNAPIIWQHLLTIWGLIDPTSQAKKILQESMKSNGSTDNEIDFLSSMIEDVSKTVEENKLDTANPMSLLTGLMSSGVLPKLINNMQDGMKNGNINLGKMVSNLSGLIGGAGGGDGGGDMLNSMMSQMGPMLSQLGGGGNNGSGQMPDMSAMMSQMGPMLSQLGGNNGQNPDMSAMMENMQKSLQSSSLKEDTEDSKAPKEDSNNK